MLDPLYLCGLGNPGKIYFYNRHNVGYLCIDYLKEKFKSSPWKNFSNRVEYSISNILDREIFFIKPIEFMNNSGKSLKLFVDYFKIGISSNIIVIYDDVEIEVGSIRIRKSGSAGSHNGMRDIISVFKTQDIPRIRIGIGPKPPNIQLKDFVLSDFKEDEKKKIENIFNYISTFIPVIFEKGLDYVISRYNMSL